ncbi:MAG: hypothetical protein AAF940_02390 [Pseudomonadota bacterium]
MQRQGLYYRLSLWLVFTITMAFPAYADDDVNIIDELTVWYAAHTDAMARDVATGLVDAALAPDVRITLEAFDIEQNKSEYLESFDGWQDAIEGGLVAPRVERVDGRVASVLVCYVFEDNVVLNRETVTFNDDMQIAALIAEQLAENCADL